MNKKDIITLILQEIEDISIITKAFKNEDTIHPIEINLCLSKVQNLHDELQLLQDTVITDSSKSITEEAPEESFMSDELKELIAEHEAQKAANEETPSEVETVSNTIITTELKPEVETIEETTIQAEVKKADSQVLEPAIAKAEATSEIVKEAEEVEEPKTIEAVEVKQARKNIQVKENRTEIETPAKPKAKEKKLAKKTIGDELGSNKKSLHDVIAQNNFNKDIVTRFKSKPINDIKKAIPLNDRIWFTRELFNGNADDYAETVEEINKLSDLNNALNFIQEKHNWNGDNKVVQKFLSIISRKFQ